MTSHSSLDLARPLVIAVVHRPGDLAAAARLAPGAAPDLLEIRLDAFAADLAPLDAALPALPRPLLLTARHPAEGGENALSPAARRALLRRFLVLPGVAALDCELRSVRSLALVIAEARAAGIRIVLSAHDFAGCPSSARLRDLLRRAALCQPDVIKLAVRAETPAHLARLLALFPENSPSSESTPRLALMGMGAFGKISRLALARAGSVLNYGYLETPNAPGQWPAALLRERLDEVTQ